MKDEIAQLSKKITPARLGKMRRVLDGRTRALTVALEDIFQPHNAAAVMRNCDAFGVQDVSIIENKYVCRLSRSVDMGTSKWLTIRRQTCAEAVYPKNGISQKHVVSAVAEANTLRALEDLRSRGYLIAASAPDAEMKLSQVPADSPLALLIGTELTGLTSAAQNFADFKFSFPMLGFAESLNLSVFTAICLADLSARVRASQNWRLSEEEKDALMLEWLRRSTSNREEPEE